VIADVTIPDFWIGVFVGAAALFLLFCVLAVVYRRQQ
jgi:hypothetical protein